MHNHNSFPGPPSWSGLDPMPSHHRGLAPYDLPQFWTPDLFYPRARAGLDPTLGHHRGLAPYDLPQYWTPELFYPRRDGGSGCLGLVLLVLAIGFGLAHEALQAVGCLSASKPTSVADAGAGADEPAALELGGDAEHIHVVVPGDTLSGIAAKYLGDGAKWSELLQLNPEITDPNLLIVGQRIRWALPPSDQPNTD